ncbi:GTPASE IMAP FAMILY MEMBER-RELATED [Salix purpurea]|uniref:GTPASE IMAP FAMILY MEMBER-RELATED n=1 Tax=Salix purpurea TaxID=77065 RepID=A0A9Q0PQZ0_SALPP|nr:GTPASE IMAP FAMILY MEMBER-RELATED [Salix purpurea]
MGWVLNIRRLHLDEKSGEWKGDGESDKEAGNNELIGGEEVSEITVNGETQAFRSEGEVNSNREIESSKELNSDGDYAQEVGNNEMTGDAEVSEIAGKIVKNALKGENEVNPNPEIELSKEILPEDGEREELKEDNVEVSEIAGNIGTKALKGEDEADPNREIELSKEILPENGEREELEDNAEVSEIASNIGTEALKGDDDPNREIELSKEILSEDGEREELKEDKLGAQHHEANESINLSGDLRGDKSEGLDENLEKIDVKHDVEKNVDFDSATVGLDAGNGVNKSEQLGDISEVVDIENHDDSNGKLSDFSAVIASEQNGESHELKAASSVPQTVMEEEKLVPGVLASSSLQKSVTERNEGIQAHASNVRAEDNKGSEVHHAANNINGVSTVINVTEESQKKADQGQEDKQTPPAIIERKIQHLPGIASSSAKSSSAAPPPSRPAGLGRAAPLLEPAPRAVQQPPRANGAVSHTQSQQIDDPANGESEEFDETREKLQMIRVKFLRLAHRLGQTPHNVVVAQVLYRLGLAEQLRGRSGGRVAGFSFDRASAMAEQLEAAGQEPLDFSCTIMVLGKTGVGKSATINSIFDEVKFGTDAFQLGTKKVQDVVGTVQGIKVRVIDTPGLLPSWSDQRQNEKILHSVKRFIKKTPPDIVLYLDRLDMQSRDFGDMPLLRTITNVFGPSIWFNAIVVLTHAASAPPDGPNGTASSYDMFVTQRSHAVQQAIRQAAGDMRLMNPVSLVENHSACRTNRAGQRVLPNGQVWKPHLLLLSFASKILAEANALLKLQDSTPAKPFATRSRAPPLPFLLSSLLQSRAQVKLPEEQYGDEDGFR